MTTLARPRPGAPMGRPFPPSRPVSRRRRAVRPAPEHLEGRLLLSAGDLDPTFGSGGIVNTSDHPSSVFVQSGGKILTVGWTESSKSHRFAVSMVRYNSSGKLDSTFGSNGQVTSSVFTDFNGAAIYPTTGTANDGKIVVTNGTFGLARFKTNGSLDTTFGTKGVATTTFPAGTWYPYSDAILVQPDGKILEAGSLSTPWGTGANHKVFALVRYNANGTLDGTFGTGGIDLIAPGPGDSQINGIGLQSDGRIVAAASVGLVLGGALEPTTFAVARFNTNGSLDTSFGSGATGVAPILQLPAGSDANALAIQTNGEIVAAGDMGMATGPSQFLVARFNTGGTLDSSFGTSGTAIPPLAGNSIAYAVALQADGGIVAGGAGGTNAALVRYSSSGQLDTTFGTGGIVLTSLGGAGHFSVTIQPADGNILTTGIAPFSGPTSQYLARYLGSATLPTSSLSGSATSPVTMARTTWRIAKRDGATPTVLPSIRSTSRFLAARRPRQDAIAPADTHRPVSTVRP